MVESSHKIKPQQLIIRKCRDTFKYHSSTIVKKSRWKTSTNTRLNKDKKKTESQITKRYFV